VLVARKILCACLAVSAVATVAPASFAVADSHGDFGSRGELIISAERLSPLFSYARTKQDQGGGDSTTTSATSISLLWSGAIQDVYDIPRVGADYVLAPNVTLGGDLFITLPTSSSRSTTMNGTTTSRDSTKLSAFGIAARGGYIVPLAHGVSLWARGALSYIRLGTTNPQGNMGNTSSSAFTQWGLSLEGLFVIQATPHLGVTLGPVLDLPLSGNLHTEDTVGTATVSTDSDETQLHFGITAGLIGWM
jgi:hypothetical protein